MPHAFNRTALQFEQAARKRALCGWLCRSAGPLLDFDVAFDAVHCPAREPSNRPGFQGCVVQVLEELVLHCLTAVGKGPPAVAVQVSTDGADLCDALHGKLCEALHGGICQLQPCTAWQYREKKQAGKEMHAHHIADYLCRTCTLGNIVQKGSVGSVLILLSRNSLALMVRLLCRSALYRREITCTKWHPFRIAVFPPRFNKGTSINQLLSCV